MSDTDKKLCPICGKEKSDCRYKYCSLKCMHEGKKILQKKYREEYGTNLHNVHGQPCWECKNYVNGCSWSRSLQPVKGWIAEQTQRKESGKISGIGYKIKYCPEFISDRE